MNYFLFDLIEKKDNNIGTIKGREKGRNKKRRKAAREKRDRECVCLGIDSLTRFICTETIDSPAPGWPEAQQQQRVPRSIQLPSSYSQI